MGTALAGPDHRRRRVGRKTGRWLPGIPVNTGIVPTALQDNADLAGAAMAAAAV